MLIEGGSKVYSAFIRQKLFDDIIMFISPKILGGGVQFVNQIGIENVKNSLNLKLHGYEVLGNDIVAEYIL